MGVKVELHSCLTTELDGSERSVSCPGHFIPPSQGKHPLILNRRLCGPKVQSGHFGEETNLLSLLMI